MRLIILLIMMASMSSCMRGIISLKGKYQETPVKSKYEIPFNEVWENVIDFISDTGQEVQMIDKESGIIISDAHLASGKLLSHEDRDGNLVNKKALVAVTR